MGIGRITALLQQEGWRVNHKRVERIWRQEGLKVPQKQPKRARLWLADGSCLRQRPEYPNHVWSYDFVMERTQDGRPLKMLTVVDEYTRECLAIAVRRRLTSREVQEVLSELFLQRGCPTHIRSDNVLYAERKPAVRTDLSCAVGTAPLHESAHPPYGLPRDMRRCSP